jgi:hypothetical protein
MTNRVPLLLQGKTHVRNARVDLGELPKPVQNLRNPSLRLWKQGLWKVPNRPLVK